ncbi:DUF4175 family protein [Tundrisphaera lichenicola]|uniref:DUF4175 family protein n=1 Tax=Tundrisphaera lichenicola TaxID=2029860 RepID=UPI003EBD4E35
MRGPIEARLASLRGQVRRLLALHGLSRLAFGLTAAILVACLADWLIHLAPELRLILLIGVIGLGAWLTIRRVILPLVVKFADLDIALRIEERWPGLNDRLASTVQFLRSDRGHDEQLGSQALRDATVEQTLAEVESIDFRQVVDPRSSWKAAGWAFAILTLMGAVVAVEPALSGIALRRLFRPFGPEAWPRSTHLTVSADTPKKLARGMPFALAVGIGPGERMPSTARVTYRYPDGETTTELLRPTDDNTFRGRLESVAQPFTFSVEAGDDVTRPWAVEVVPPPVLESPVVRVVAPEYTALRPQELAVGNTQVRVVEGTRVELTARANKPIASATLRRGDAPAPEPVAISDGGTAISTAFVAKESQPFWVELKDTEGFTGQEAVRFDVRVTRDEAPRVSVDEPTNDRDVPPAATVPLQFTIDDDFGLQLVRLVYKVASGQSEPAGETILPLWAAPEPHGETGPVRRQEVRYRWDLSTLPDLQPGSVITLYAEARDFDNLKGPNIGRSREIRLRIVSKEELDRQREDQLRAIREEADRVLAIQKQAKAPVDDALRTLSKTDKLPEPVRDQVKNAEIVQRQVNNRISNRADGLEQKIRQFQQDTRDFKAENPDVDRQMARLDEAVQRIKDRNLGPAEKALSDANKSLDPAGASDSSKPPQGDPSQSDGKATPPSKDPAGSQPKAQDPSKGEASKGEASKGEASKGEASKGEASKGEASKGEASKGEASKGEASEGGKPEGASKPEASKPGEPSQDQGQAPKQALAEAEKNQKAIVDELENMLGELSQFDTVRSAVKDAKELLGQQEQAMKESAEAAGKPELMGKSQDALTPEQKAELENLAARQKEIAEGLSKLEGKLDEMGKKLEDSDPLTSRALKDAAEATRKEATAAKMAEAAEQLEKNQMGQAQEGQAQARNDLKKMLDEIENRRERELSRLVAELKAAEAGLKKLRAEQAANLKKTQQARQEADPKKRADQLKQLAKEQKRIEEELKKQLQKLAKLNNEAGAKAGQKAAESMAKAGQDMEQDQGEEAEGEEEEALQDLKQAQEEVAEARKEAEEQLAMEQIAKMGDALKSIGERQAKMVEETNRYEQLRQENQDRLSLAQRTGVRDLGRVQAGLKDEASELIDRLGEGAPVFNLTLKKAAEGMEDAAQRLQALKTDEATVQAEKRAAGRFQQLIDSLKPDKPKGGQGQQQQGGGGQGGSPQGGDGIPASAQIKMLKLLQEEINERTDSFDELRRRQKELDPEQTAALDKLHEDQGTLADIVRDLTKPKKDDGEE